MRKRQLIIFIVIALSLLITACSGNANISLQNVDEIIEANPDSALTMLEGMDRSDYDKEDSAYYALLYTQAQIKTYVELDNDSLIRKAYKFYHTSLTGSKCIRAYFYKGEVAFNARHRAVAIRELLTARDIALNDKDYGWTARSAELLSDVFAHSGNYQQAEPYSCEAVKYFGINNEENRKRYAIIDLSMMRLNLGKTEQALKSLDSLNNIFKKSNDVDDNLKEYLKMPYMDALMSKNRVAEARKIYANMQKDSLTPAHAVEMAIIQGEFNITDKNYESAQEAFYDALLIATTKDDSLRLLYMSYCAAIKAEDYKRAVMGADSLLLLQSQLTVEYARESLVGVQRDFIAEKAAIDKRDSAIKVLILVFIIIIVLCLTITLCIIHKLKLRAKSNELREILDSFNDIKLVSQQYEAELKKTTKQLKLQTDAYNDLHRKLDEYSQDKSQDSDSIESLYRDKWETLNTLCDEYFDIEGTENKRTVIFNKVEKELKKLKNKRNLEEIEKAVDFYFNGIITRLKSECPTLSTDDLTLATLSYAGLSARAICLILNIKYKNLYLRKSRLMQKIKDSDAESKTLFIDKFGKTPKNQ